MPASTKKKPPTRKNAKTKPSGQRAQARVPAPREGSKASLILDLLRRGSGASLAELGAAAGWQPHSVRGFLSGTLRKRHGLALTTEFRDGQRHYRIDGTGARS